MKRFKAVHTVKENGYFHTLTVPGFEVVTIRTQRPHRYGPGVRGFVDQITGNLMRKFWDVNGSCTLEVSVAVD